MSDSELMIQIEKDRESILPKSIPFMKAVLAERQKRIDDDKYETNRSHQDEMLNEARSANSNSKQANLIAVLALIVSAIALFFSLK